MADCSYSRCIQQRKNIRRELQRWTKNMVYIVGLERIAEELMGRRKWKLYQDSMQRNYLQPLNNNVKKYTTKETDDKDEQHQQHQHRPKLAEQFEGDNNSGANEVIGNSSIKPEDTPSPSTPNNNSRDEAQNNHTGSRSRDLDEDPDEENRVKDWSPQSKCYFCVDGKLDEHNNHGALSPRQSDSDSSDSPSDLEVPPTLTPSATTLFNNHRKMAALETSVAALAAVAALSGTPQGPIGPHLPFYPPNMLATPNWYQLSNLAARGFQAADRLEAEKAVIGSAACGNGPGSGGGNGTGGEQPLDLSSKGGQPVANDAKLNNANNNSSMRLPSIDSKHIFNSDFRAKPRMSAVGGRRTYTEEELQAALRDIQSGKLGTRRAAVIYGIPRSTLRNKVYKLALERERESHLNTAASLKIDEEDGMDDEKELSGAEEEKEVEKALERPLLSMADILTLTNLDNAEALKAFLQKNKDGQEAYAASLEHSAALGPQLQTFLLRSLMSGQKFMDGADAAVPDVIKHMMAEELRMNELKSQNNGDSDRLSRPSPSNSVAKTDKSKSESDMETEDSTANVILRIPSFKPTSSKNGDYRGSIDSAGSLISPTITSDSGSPPILPGKGMSQKDVKDLIAKSISQKFQQSPEPLRHPIIDMDFKRGGFTPPLSGMSVIKSQQDLRTFQQSQQQQTQQNQKQSNSSSNNSGGKGTRPKRGKYRNYDRDSLVEAVRAVQRGEMSVHRAGSYYGVPHSTLEYKVKERHLMRPRKRDPKPNPVDEKIASLKQSDMRNAAAAAAAAASATEKLGSPGIKPPQKFPPNSPNGIKLPMYDGSLGPLYNPPPFPFWPHAGYHIPLDYARNPAAATAFTQNPEQFFASQMIQKLHEESSRTLNVPNATSPALAKSARQMAESLLDTTGSNGFLDGIIRSSLESGVPSNDDKREDKGVAPENMSNKALLDQLCRNSRLTPLTKPSYCETADDDKSATKQDGTDHSDGHDDDRKPEIQTIELSNDSNDSSKANSSEERNNDVAVSAAPGRIYLKQELTKPENLKPEMLVRCSRDALHDVDNNRNGMTEGSASESDAAQD